MQQCQRTNQFVPDGCAHPYGYASTINIWGSTSDGPGIPPTDESVFISVNDDFDEGNEDSAGKPLPDNMPDATAGHRIDYGPDGTWDWGWDLAGMYLYTSSTDGNPSNPATYSLSFPDTIKIWRWDGTPNDGTAWEEIDSGESFDADETDYVNGWWPGFIVEGIEPSQSLHDVGITATFTKGHSVQDTVRFTVMQTDLDIDSDNNDELDDPARSPQEDHIEQVYGDDDYPGKIIAVNDDDSDGDGVPDYADGYKLPSDEEGATDESENDAFVPLKLSIPQPIDLNTARIAFFYSASNPWRSNDENYPGGHMQISGDGSVEDPYVYEPVGGNLRIWKEIASEPRSALDAIDGGDFVSSGLHLVGSEWTGYSIDDLGSARDVDLWVEAIHPDASIGASDIRVFVDPDGTGNAGWWLTTDVVRLTSARVEIVAQHINKDAPDANTYQLTPRAGAAGRSVIYGGSERSTSDELLLYVDVTPEALVPSSFSWTVSNEEAVQNAPPVPSANSSYDVGYVLAGDPVLNVGVTATIFGAPISGGRSFEIGVRTDDVVVVGWIDRTLVSPNSAEVHPAIVDLFREDGTSGSPAAAGVLLLEISLGVKTFAADGITYPITPADAEYLTNWLFKYSGNSDPRQAVAGGDFRTADGTAIDYTELANFVNARTNYKLFNRMQLRYRRDVDGFRGVPNLLQHEVHVGDTVNALGLPPYIHAGQVGPAMTFDPLLVNGPGSRVTSIVDGSPDATGINALNTLSTIVFMPDIFWENIGSRITFYHDGDFTGDMTKPLIVTQPYPTYFVYLNGKLHPELTQQQALSPFANFHTHPYPFGPGGRGGDAESPAAAGSRIPSYTVP